MKPTTKRARPRKNSRKPSPAYAAYRKAVEGPPVMMVLRSHLLTEYHLERIIRACMLRGDKLIESGNLTYANKLAIVEAISALPDILISCLRNLNRLRNRCAHEFDRTITVADCDSVGGPLGRDYAGFKHRFQEDAATLMAHVIGAMIATLSAYVDIIEKFPPDAQFKLFQENLGAPVRKGELDRGKQEAPVTGEEVGVKKES